jgi:hypothetical protein
LLDCIYILFVNLILDLKFIFKVALYYFKLYSKI